MGNFSPAGAASSSGHKKRARTPNGKGARCPKCAHAQPHFVSCVHGPQHAAGACARMPLGGPEAGCWPRRRCAAGALLLAGGGATRMVCNLSRCAPIPMEPSSLTYTFYAQLILTGGSAAAQDEVAGGGRGAGDELWRDDRSDGGARARHAGTNRCAADAFCAPALLTDRARPPGRMSAPPDESKVSLETAAPSASSASPSPTSPSPPGFARPPTTNLLIRRILSSG